LFTSGSPTFFGNPNIIVTTGGVQHGHNFNLPMPFLNMPSSAAVFPQFFGHVVKIYADPGTTVINEGPCQMTLAGQLVSP